MEITRKRVIILIIVIIVAAVLGRLALIYRRGFVYGYLEVIYYDIY